jgi:hypothetical protein
MGLSENAAALHRRLGEDSDPIDPDRLRSLAETIADEAQRLALASQSFYGPGLPGLIANLVTLKSPDTLRKVTVTINGHRASPDVAAAYALMRYGLAALEQPVTATPEAADRYHHHLALMLGGHNGADTTGYAAMNLVRADRKREQEPPSEEVIAREVRNANNPFCAPDQRPAPGPRAGIRENADAISQALSSADDLDQAAVRHRVRQLARETAILAQVTGTPYGAGKTDLIRVLLGPPKRSGDARDESVTVNGHCLRSDVAAIYAVMRHGPEVIEAPTTATLYASDIYWHLVGRLLSGAHIAQWPHARALSLLRSDQAQDAAPPSEHPIARTLRDAWSDHSATSPPT